MKYIERIHNVETNEVIERPLAEEEIAEVEACKAEAETKAQADAAEEAAKISSKLAIYAKLGLTEEEINTLIS